ncbi:hypothetical protein BGX31_009029 [Mortierella sp. GBA43]|nr:hypothetical protein BGX31_009029 [Mortierella sp. GBA43]
MIESIANAYVDLGIILERRGYGDKARAIYEKAERLGVAVQSVKSSLTAGPSQHNHIALVPSHIFPEDISPPAVEFKLPEPDERLDSTQQLVCCLGLLQVAQSHDLRLKAAAQKWLQAIENDTDEQERLSSMATDLIRIFKQDELKDAKAIAEVVCLSPILNKEDFQSLLKEFYLGIDHSGLLDVQQLMGLVQLIQGADPNHLSPDDLVKILRLFSDRLRDTHTQSADYMYQSTLAISHILDAMADTKVTGLDRKALHEPIVTYLKELKRSPDPYLIYQAAYAFQAILCIPDDEKTWQTVLRRTGMILQGASGVASAVQCLDLNKFTQGLEDLQRGLVGPNKIIDVIQTAYKNATVLVQSGQTFLQCLKEGFSFDRKRDWYSALRGADALIREGKLATFRRLVCEAPCRLDPAFQWGVCQRLGVIASNTMWDANIRLEAIGFLGEIYQNDEIWGQPSVKQWIINILMHVKSLPGPEMKCK